MAEQVSIVIAAEEGAEVVERCLESAPIGEEVGAYVGRPQGLPGPAERAGLAVRREPGSPTRMELRAAAMAAAPGQAVAVLNEDYTVGPDWIDAVRATAGCGAEVVCGEVDPPARAGWAARAAYLWEYSHLVPPRRAGRLSAAEARWIPAGCAVYRGGARDPERFRSAANELECHERMAADGMRFHRDPALRTAYHPPPLRDFLAARRRWSKQWAVSSGRSGLGAWLRLAALGPVLAARSAANVAGRPRWWVPWLWAAPLFVVFAAMQVVGELDALLAADTE